MSSLPAATSSTRTTSENGMLFMILAMLVVPGMDALAKLLTDTLSPGVIALGRFFFQTLLLLPLMLVLRRPLLTTRWRLHALRGALIALATLLIFWAFQYLPLANALAIFFVEPLLLTLLSALFLGEKVGVRRLTAVVVGLVGALIVIRPNWQAFGWATVLPLGTAFCFAGYLALTRHAAAAEDALTMQFWVGIFGALFMLAALVLGTLLEIRILAVTLPVLADWVLLVGVGVIATVSHVLIAVAFRRTSASLLAPFQYLEIVSATLLGYLLFGDFPDALTWLGTVVIIGAGLYVFFRERQLSRVTMVSDSLP